MKTIKILLLVTVFSFGQLITANTTPNSEPATTISGEIEKLLENPSFDVDQDLTATVKLVINDNNEMVVLSVNSENSELDGFIKSRLNYTKLSSQLSSGKKTYLVPVTIKQEG